MTRSRHRSPLRSLAGLSRVALLLTSLLAGSALFFVHSSLARARTGFMELGEHLDALAEAGLGQSHRRVELNGQAVGFRVFLSELPMEGILDHYEGWCRRGQDAFEDQEGKLAAGAPRSLRGDQSWRELTVRADAGEQGFVSCLHHGDANASATRLSQRLEAFLRTGNLAELGTFHYVFVQEVEGTRRVICVWTEGDFYPFDLFPEQGDAPGRDLPDGLRPPGMRRMLSAAELGERAALHVYVDGTTSVPELTAHYRELCRGGGWGLAGESKLGDSGTLLVLRQGSLSQLIAIDAEPGDTPTVLVVSTAD